MTDAAGGKTLQQVVNKMLADCAWGSVDRSNDPKWKPASKALSFSKPIDLPSHTITYSKYLDEILYPRETITDESKLFK